MHENLKLNPPKIYAYGLNPKKQFGISTHLSYLVEIETPNFDINETIENLTIGNKHTIIITNKNRAFISTKIQVTGTRKTSTNSNQSAK